MLSDCAPCCFFRLVETKGRHKRRLCMLSGETRPVAGAVGCHFLAGAWSQIDAILGLPKARVYGNTGLPNITKQGNRFIIATNDIDDYSVNPISHIAAKAERQPVRPGTREGQVVS